MFLRRSEIVLDRPSLLLIHGLGESGLCFQEAFAHPLLRDRYNIVAPDLLGFGRSDAAADGDYSFARQIARLWQLIDSFPLETFNLVGHSMGGDIGALICAGDDQDRVERFVNIEGDLSEGDRFITDQALKSDASGRFETWLSQDFMGEIVPDWGRKWPSCNRYLESLKLCRPDAFLESAKQIAVWNQRLPDKKHAIIGQFHRDLPQPKRFCFGDHSVSPESRTFLKTPDLKHREFPNAFHWVMIDQADGFYRYLDRFCRGD